MTARRVAVSGLGDICALGHDLTEVWNGLRGGRSGIAPIRSLDVSKLRFQNGAEVREYDPGDHFGPDLANLLDRFAQFALIAAREAVKDSGITLTPGLRERTAVLCGSCLGGQISQDAGFVGIYLQNRDRVHPLTILGPWLMLALAISPWNS